VNGGPRMFGSPELRELGHRIRKLRVERRMTLKQVEESSGLSATHLSEIERGRTSPTIGELIRVARSLRREPSYFIEPEERADVAHVRRENLTPLKVSPGVIAEPLTPGIPGSEINAYRVRMQSAPGVEWRLAPQATPGDALYLVTRGAVEATFGETRVTLSTGDSMQASLTLAQHLRSKAVESAEIIVILTRSLGGP